MVLDIEDHGTPMSCFQCEQTLKPTGCIRAGVCGKAPKTALIQDTVAYACAYLSRSAQMDDMLLLIQAIFATLTNVNFDDDALIHRFLIPLCDRIRACPCSKEQSVADFLKLAKSVAEEPFEQWHSMARKTLSPDVLKQKYGPTNGGLRYMIVLGVKGMAAYADHAYNLTTLLQSDPGVLFQAFSEMCPYLHKALLEEKLETAELLEFSLAIGRINLRVTELLDKFHAEALGVPTLCSVPIRLQPGKCVLISGHDFVDMYFLLQACEKEGINVYTHGEMFPAYSYPKLRGFKCFKGHFGGAWYRQQKELPHFPGAIVFTTNCIQTPLPSYRDRVFTMGCVGFTGLPHIERTDFSALIKCAKECTGFTSPQHCRETEEAVINSDLGKNCQLDAVHGVGFNHRALDDPATLSKLVGLIKAGKIKRIQVNGGCDGMNSARSVFGKNAFEAPDDTLILTGACGRFRFNRLREYGDIEGIPRLLDTGQCNDFYSIACIAKRVAEQLGCNVNDLPLDLYVSWYEQKAVVQLLTFLHLGIKGIHLGPTMPLFLSPEALGTLSEAFDLRPILAQ